MQICGIATARRSFEATAIQHINVSSVIGNQSISLKFTRRSGNADTADTEHTDANAKAQYINTASARTDARLAIADADYNVNKIKCASQNGNAKDVCLKQADATQVAAVANAKADQKINDARMDAREDIQSADYKAALGKCEALAGPSKKSCVAAAIAQFSK